MVRFGFVLGFVSLVLVLQPCTAFCREIAVHGEANVLDNLRKALARYASLDLEASIHSLHTGSAGDEAGPVVANTVLRVKRLRSRVMRSTKERIDRPSYEPFFSQNDFIVYDSGDVLYVRTHLDSSLRQLHRGQSRLGLVLYSNRLAGTQEIDRESVYHGLNDSGAALWNIGYAPLIDYIDEGSELVVTPTDDGAQILAASEHGRLKLTLSGSHDWLPGSFELLKGRGHRTLRGVIGDDIDGTVTESIFWKGEVSSFKQDAAGRWAPSRMEVRRRMRFKTQPVGTVVTTIQFKHVTYDPPLTESDFQTDIVVPVGQRVSVNGATHLPYRWDGLTPVPGVPNMPHRAVETLTTEGGVKRVLLIAINLVLVLVLIFFLWRKWAMA